MVPTAYTKGAEYAKAVEVSQDLSSALAITPTAWYLPTASSSSPNPLLALAPGPPDEQLTMIHERIVTRMPARESTSTSARLDFCCHNAQGNTHHARNNAQGNPQ